ncbi:MAG TPA: SLC13/DASS family transporter [Myxococcales bacterium]|nr:SLC13/DASS family transporter [Myxococcales bacterium]HIN85886.1 SLC13/DASS family transporter [Myxococcales bacterium]
MAHSNEGTGGDLSPGAIRVGAIAFLMAVWWVTEAIPIPATSLLPLVLFPLLGISPSKATAVAYASPFIILLMGGFFVALTLERWNLHKRIALNLIIRIGTRPDRLILGFMVAGALLSMWISNTATTLMMLPIAVAVLQRVDETGADPDKVRKIGVGLMLGIAYACNVGGIGTPIGTPPNLIFIGQFETAFPDRPPIGFIDWMIMTLPIVVIMIAIIWFVLTRWINRVDRDISIGDESSLKNELNDMGGLSSAERRVAVVFVFTALAWIFRRPIEIGNMAIPGWSNLLELQKVVDDGTVAIAAAIVLFLLPAGKGNKGVRLLDWETAVRIPWGLLLLFGGGLALADGFKVTGFSEWVGQELAGLATLSPWVLIGVVCLAVTFLTEITSNTATTTILMPVFAAVCVKQGVDPYHLMLPAALSASCAFMLPVATAPNAIVFGSGRVKMADMVRCGIVINLIGVVVITLLI